MPLPKHKPGEERNKFVSRCMGDPNSKKNFQTLNKGSVTASKKPKKTVKAHL